MARIRTIKPEFPQSESMGRVSRDARLLFVMLWTIADDHGRARAHSRMLASLLFPYDDDAGEGVKLWLKELENEGCIRLYEVSGSQYLQILNWSKHQRVDKPSRPQFPDPPDGAREDSRKPRERSSEEGTKEGTKEGRGGECEGNQSTGNLLGDEGDVSELPDEAITVTATYNATLPDCQSVQVLNPKRRKRIVAACKLARRVCRQQGWPYDPAQFWTAYWAECLADDWLGGRKPNPKNPTWKQNLDVLLEEDRFAGIMDRAIAAMRLEEAA